MQKTKKYLTILAYTIPSLIFVCYILFLCFMPKEVAVHFNLEGNVDRYGSKYEFLITAFVFYLIPMVLTLIYDRVKMPDLYKVVGLSCALAMPLAFIGVTIYFFVKVAINSVGVIFLLENRISFILTFVAALIFIATHILPFVYGKQKFKKEITQKYYYVIYILMGVCSFGILIGTLFLGNYYSFIVFFGLIALAIAVWYIFAIVIKKIENKSK